MGSGLLTDQLGNLTLGTADKAVMGYEYDGSGNQTAMIDENGNTALAYFRFYHLKTLD
jgi:YD repeat-containing protein